MKPEQKQKGHPHAELMKLYAEDAMESETPWENWECNDPAYDKEWTALRVNPLWFNHLKYRRKPRFIEINGHQVPEPVKDKNLLIGNGYYSPEFCQNYHVYFYKWQGRTYDEDRFKLGLIHLTKEAAIAHAKALLSFTSHDHQNT